MKRKPRAHHGLAIALALMLLPGAQAHAKPATPVTLSNDKPVDVAADTLEVQQDQHQAIFTGNVVASQGGIHMRADKMIVHYVNQGGASATKSAPAEKTTTTAPDANGIRQIDASGHVVFTNATDTAKGDFATYDVEAQTLDLTGQVLLTRDQNVLKGTHMHYDMATARSVLTAGGVAVSDSGGKSSGNGRVHGLFIPNQKKTGAK